MQPVSLRLLSFKLLTLKARTPYLVIQRELYFWSVNSYCELLILCLDWKSPSITSNKYYIQHI